MMQGKKSFLLFRDRSRTSLCDQSGQTAVEYMLMLVIVVGALNAGLSAAAPYITEWLLTIHKNIGTTVQYGVPEGDLFDHFIIF